MDSEAKQKQLSIAECDAQLCKPGTIFELETVRIQGRPQTVWKHLPRTMRDFMLERFKVHSDKILLNSPAPEPRPVSERIEWTFKQIYDLALPTAGWLRSEGIKEGSFVGIVGYNSAEWVASWVAINILGAVPVIVNAATQADSMVHCLKITRPMLVLADALSATALAPRSADLGAAGVGQVISWQDSRHLAEGDAVARTINLGNLNVSTAVVDDVLAGVGITQLHPDSDGVIFFTSGTTGYPKAVLSSQRAALHGCISSLIPLARAGMRMGAPAKMVMQMLEVPPETQNIALMAVPFFHVTGCLSILLKSVGDGNQLVLMRRWDVKEAVRLMVKTKVNIVSGVPAILLAIMKSGLLPKDHSLTAASYGGAPAPERMPKDIKNRWPDIGMITAWGMTETNAIHTVNVGDDYLARPKSAGPSLPISEVRIVDPDTHLVVPNGTVGVIEARGANVMKGYYNDDNANEKSINKEGWFDTGDAGWLDDDGFLYVSDRIKDIIIRGGENVSSEEVENAIYLDDRVAEAAAVAIPDDTLGELVGVAVSLSPGARATDQDIIEKVWTRVRSHARPSFVWVADKPLPRNANGKLVKTDIKRIVQDLYAKKQKREAKL